MNCRDKNALLSFEKSNLSAYNKAAHKWITTYHFHPVKMSQTGHEHSRIRQRRVKDYGKNKTVLNNVLWTFRKQKQYVRKRSKTEVNADTFTWKCVCVCVYLYVAFRLENTVKSKTFLKKKNHSFITSLYSVYCCLVTVTATWFFI